jgi:hypothetical protein
MPLLLIWSPSSIREPIVLVKLTSFRLVPVSDGSLSLLALLAQKIPPFQPPGSHQGKGSEPGQRCLECWEKRNSCGSHSSLPSRPVGNRVWASTIGHGLIWKVCLLKLQWEAMQKSCHCHFEGCLLHEKDGGLQARSSQKTIS